MSDPAARRNTLREALESARVIVCAGTGGVGKTTISAALALQAARAGRRTLVLTIDPARRLADALGIDIEGSELAAVEVDVDITASDGADGRALDEIVEGGSLRVLMLDPKPTFDRLVRSLTDDAETQERILGNRIYKQLSEALAGSAEYAAMEQVYEVIDEDEYDLVVVDTPPSSHALDFLEAPRHLRAFLSGRFVAALVRPALSAGRFGLWVFGRSMQRIMGLIERVAGTGFIDDMSEFLSAIAGLADGFLDRASRVESILLGESTRFVLIGGARSGSEPGTLEFLEELRHLDVELAAVVLNRIAPWPLEETAQSWLARANGEVLGRDALILREALESSGEPELAAERADSITQLLREAALARAEADRSREHIEKRLGDPSIPCTLIAERAQDVDRLTGLLDLGLELKAEFPS